MSDALTADYAAPDKVRSHRLMMAIAAFFIIIKMIYTFYVPPMFDEAYYWIWGQHPELSYFDHPPFQAWLLGLSDFVFGRNLFGLRWMTIATMLGIFWIFASAAKRYAGAQWRDYFWPGVVIYVASPTFGFFMSLAFHDYLLIFLCLLATHLFLNVLTTFRESGTVRLRDLYFAAIVLGCAGLTKYSAVFLGLAVLGYVIASRPLRPLLRNLHFYAAGVLAALMQAPVLIWNMQNEFASFRFHLVDRHRENWLERFDLYWFADFVFVTLLLVSPAIIIAIIRFITTRQQTEFERTARGLAGWAFVLSTGTFVYVSLFDSTFWWWNIVAYVPALPFLAKAMGQRLLFYGHVALGAVLALFLIITSAVIPIYPLLGLSDPIRIGLYGQELLEAPIKRLQASHGTKFVAALGPETASIVAFQLDDPSVTALVKRTTEFAFLFDAQAHAGENAIVVMREGEPIAEASERFGAFTKLESVSVDRFGRHLSGFDFYLGEDYIPPPPGLTP